MTQLSYPDDIEYGYRNLGTQICQRGYIYVKYFWRENSYFYMYSY